MTEIGPDLVGQVVELDVGPVAHGGHCVARLGDEPHGRVVFVRHTLPGERVRAVITEDGGGSFCRGDAVEVLRASPDRVPAPCPHARPGRCGGCDWQHAAGHAQRALKAAVVREQLARLAGLDLPVVVEPLPGGLLGWRTRTLYAVDGAGRLGLRKHRSHEVELLDRCPLGAAGVGDAPELARSWDPALVGVELAVGAGDGRAVLEHRRAPSRSGGPGSPRGRRPPDRVSAVSGPPALQHDVRGRRFEVAASGFWQVHPAAAEAFTGAALELLALQPGESVLDLYAGAGLFTALLAQAVGPAGSVRGFEADPQAVQDAAGNLADLPQAGVHRERVSAALVRSAGPVQAVLLDPPRTGAGPEVMTAVVEVARRAVCYVACDPAALARDVAAARSRGWTVAALRAFDAFPMTAHVECIALLVP